ncbi:hypothetical protein GKE82_23390 [Conexibacter sp. W3-3-2]|uniref:hypothetical protein n=1 Tax=Conexibacter sp. W3-3-2 TaxID=2675227 RepID=UPI0012B808CD|nr:hypothetical protein [Conexibacter sp. W3-3-2]MTD47149.1 hypothetical protein [Conexibacter sp. W3-3-2]
MINITPPAGPSDLQRYLVQIQDGAHAHILDRATQQHSRQLGIADALHAMNLLELAWRAHAASEDLHAHTDRCEALADHARREHHHQRHRVGLPT